MSDDGCSNMLTLLWQVSYPSPAANSSVALRVVDEKIKELFEQFGLEHLLQLYGFDTIRLGSCSLFAVDIVQLEFHILLLRMEQLTMNVF